ncbi:hypothetical protein B484DRAFT_459387 [Ochromonadaceae sp. CCMP2298]|nr:hypothetical protein B484DRAFT_459387 [Ochromonadaceae sp. CCMP2298]|mmetsp:Transcript_28226/g.63127  ORF Transcript_28226/g.63127 Transcript_28226/m.63127 type:complete len:214 (+) Transcript_28226:82-723(+)
MSNWAANKVEKELKAKSLRAEALLQLQRAGQMVAKVGTQTVVQKEDSGKRGDNTLELLLRQSAAKASQIKKSSSTEPTVTITSLAQQEQQQGTPAATEAQPLPHGWQKVADKSGRCYYWNVVSNETTWEVPSAPAAHAVPETPSLPHGWVQKLHPATKQSYYVNAELGLSSFTIPVKATLDHGNTGKADTTGKRAQGTGPGSAADARSAKRKR